MRIAWRTKFLGFTVLLAVNSSDAIDRFVSPFGSHTPPFTDWATSATNIQSAIDAAAAGDQIWVTNGLYASGASLDPKGQLSNRVAIAKAVIVRSVNGPEATVIAGAATPGSTNGAQSIRCAWLGDGAVLSGFTLTQGTTSSANGNGGGAYCNSRAAIITNCIITGNRAFYGGGVAQGTIQSCVISNNIASINGGGAYNAWLMDTELRANRANSGGGVYCPSNGVAIIRCIVAENWATNMAAGVYQGSVTNCSLLSNQMPLFGGNGGGAYSALLQNCLIRSNTAALGGGGYNCTIINSALVGNFGTAFYASSSTAGQLRNCTVAGNIYGGSEGGFAVNSILYFNGNPQSPNFLQTAFTNCCTEPLGPRNLKNSVRGEPMLMSDGIHLQSGSPCIGAGNAAFATGLDLDGRAWSNPPSIGCIEWNPKPLLVSQPRVIPGMLSGQAQVIVEIAGQTPYCWWTKDGVALEDDGHVNAAHSNILSISQFNVADTGAYQMVASNSFGMVTSAVVTVNVACVDPANATPSAPYSSWATAASSLQDAIDASASGTVVLVTNGIFGSGGRLTPGDSTTNRIVLGKALTVMSVNGPDQTAIEGAWDAASTNGPGSIRCAWITDGAVLGGFTLRNGSTAQDGGGVWSGGTGLQASLVHCVVTNCTAARYGGGVYQGRMVGCAAAGNMAGAGGGLGWGFADNSTFTGNSAGAGGGVYESHLNRCEVSSNFSVGLGAAVDSAEVWFCLVASNNAFGVKQSFVSSCRLVGNTGGGAANSFVMGTLFRGNAGYASMTDTNVNCTFIQNGGGASGGYDFSTNCLFYLNGASGQSKKLNCLLQPEYFPSTLDAGPWWLSPNLLSDGVHIAADSPAIARGLDTGIPGVDLDGHPWSHPPSIGCIEWNPKPLLISQPRIVPDKTPGAAQLALEVAGQSPYCWWTKDGVALENGSRVSAAHSNIVSIAQFNVGDAGAYQVVASNSFGMITSAVVTVNVACVDPASANPSTPYGSWSSAANNIQDAIDASPIGTVVLVTNGTYSIGGRLTTGDTTTNRVVLDKALTVLSLNGPGQTIIEGAWDGSSTNGAGSIRCAWIADGAVLGGFTLRNGSAASNGGGAWSAGNGLRVSLVNCVITNCSALSYGGGAFQGRLTECSLLANTAGAGGGSAQAIVDHSLVQGNSAGNAGGAYGGLVRRSHIFANTAQQGGGFWGPGVVEGCVVALNKAVYGAGIYNNAYVFQCTVVSNISLGSMVAGVDFSSVWNSIVCFNQARVDPTYGSEFENLGGSGNYYNVCYSPYQNWITGITNDPELLDLAHVAATSPCRGAGATLGIAGFGDIDGNPWNQPPTIGCDEVLAAGLVGPLSVSVSAWPEVAAGGVMPITALLSGNASGLEWDFGDGTIATNLSFTTSYKWMNPGDYTLTATAFNLDNQVGVAGTAKVRVVPVVSPKLAGLVDSNGAFSLQFVAQPGLTYLLQSSTNLVIPIDWHLVQSFYSTGAVVSVGAPSSTEPNLFYRLQVQ